MPLIDLSNPQNPVVDGQNQTSPTLVANPSTATNAPVGPPAAVQRAVASAGSSGNTKNIQGHSLLRDVPKLDSGNVQVNTQGVKQVAGPPIQTPVPTATPAPTPKPAISAMQMAADDLKQSLGTKSAVSQPVGVVSPSLPTAISSVQAPVAGTNTLGVVAPGSSTAATANAQIKKPILPSLNPTPSAGEVFLSKNANMGDFLTLAEKRLASDLHISVGYPPMLRIDGKLIAIEGDILSLERVDVLFSEILNDRNEQLLKNDLDVDFSLTHTTGNRYRINIYHKKGTKAGAFRLIPSRIKTIAELGLPEIIYQLTEIPQGMIIFAGPTGSGKSTSIASMIHEINVNQYKHILTLEDPIEYIYPKARAMVNQREIGTDATSFKRGLREILREDPDIVLVGEMRDYETIAQTITAAETGHLVFTTLHTNSASQTIDRMIDVFPSAQQAQIRAQLANVMTAVVSQRLVPIKGGGRKAVQEIMIANAAIRNAIREAKTYQIDNMIQTSADLGMITLEKSLIHLIKSGDITLEEAKTYTSKPDELISLLRTV